MRLIIRDNAEAASSYVADYIVNRITSFSPTPTRPFVLGLPTGSSPLGIYKSLVEKYETGLVSFENVDEYISLSPTNPQSYASYMHDNFFSHVDIPPQNINLLNGLAADLAAECSRYESKIAAAGGIDLFLAGLGEDGHLAFNEPGSSLASQTRVVTLTEDTILANSRFFDNDVDKMPRMALTVGVKTVTEAKEVLMIVLGARKARALKKCVEDGVSCMWTGSALQMHEKAIVVCDEEAAGELMWKTVRHFKSVEHRESSHDHGRDQSLSTRNDLGTSETNPKTATGPLTPEATPKATAAHTSPSPISPVAETAPIILAKPVEPAQSSVYTALEKEILAQPVPKSHGLLGLLGTSSFPPIESAARHSQEPFRAQPQSHSQSDGHTSDGGSEAESEYIDLEPDRMASRLSDPAFAAEALRRLTPNPEEGRK
ncbi:hypothetical protein SMACR_03835 [Sordaria macrospora]|uniref:glucosamine-6-phosphate deaminase n=2 Tax=Sordaria macrospora TaxID=5147 RepID=F7W029_SORMK|nr:uncharacterized protein SMAC_03835 [Sordaria macrospora k-hell]KAA8630177.1 hypothetical protein SMACR_03835 [Sordaria macrospora]WPJ66515.1 hypothetical protein SMAC4_03835 [Sordaria macrospora]CCC11128.1 unnamed protein product [Sordaria macrospora k-hell]